MQVSTTQELIRAIHHSSKTHIELQAGTYQGPFRIPRSVSLQGVATEDVTILEGFLASPGIELELSFLTIAAGYQPGVSLQNGVARIRHCVASGKPLFSDDEEEVQQRSELLIFNNCTVELENSEFHGGINALELRGDSQVTAVGCTFSMGRPTIWLGGQSSMTLSSCSLRGGSGPTVYVREGSSVVASNCIVLGGAMGAQLSICVVEDSYLELSNCTVSDGVAAGLGVFDGGKAVATDCTFENNDQINAPKRNDLWCRDKAELELVRCKVGSVYVMTLAGELTPEAATELLRKGLDDNYMPAVRVALAAGADVHITRSDGTPVLIAMLDQPYSKISYRWIRRYVLSAGVDVNARDPLGRTAAFFVARDELLAELDEAGLVLDVVANDGSQPLHHLATQEAGHYRVPALLQHGADIHAVDHEGRTPLHRATAAGQRWVTEELLAAGADLEREDNAGNKPFDVSRKEARRFLRAKMKAAEKARGS